MLVRVNVFSYHEVWGGSEPFLQEISQQRSQLASDLAKNEWRINSQMTSLYIYAEASPSDASVVGI